MKKSEKARKKDFFCRAARRFFEIFALCHALHMRTEYTKRRSIENYIVWSYPQGKAVMHRVSHRAKKHRKAQNAQKYTERA
ncbi:hypothetical protein [Butyricicoccus sp. AM05-1]|uniref:hypothetical protein n=1 Tax=Butyricicoccus sp. AM05-1 TaxID=2292004 RepID=UPI0011C22140|nr:hypothetical protein [Butyricicoccus sp. AM05-1]